jgi:putative DNA primase/helicase
MSRRDELEGVIPGVPSLQSDPGDEPLTDAGNAERLVALYGPEILFVAELRAWLCWDGSRWALDKTGEVFRRAKETARVMYHQAADLEGDKRRDLASWAMRSEAEPRIRAMVNLAKNEPGVTVTLDQLDRDPFLLSVENGTLNLRSGELRPAEQADLITRRAPVTYDPAATCPMWDAFLKRILTGDADLIGFIQRAIGYSLTGLTVEQVIFLLHGLGANGKSVFLEVIRALLGDYAAGADFSTFLDRRQSGPRNDVARLLGRRYVTAVEASDGERLAESLVKQLTGNDTVTARHLYAESFEYRPTFKIWCAANHKPTIRGTDHAIWRRIRLVPFTLTIPEHERDPRLSEKLKAELSGILNWALEGCRAWQRDGLGASPAVRQATADYRLDQDTIGRFLDDCARLTGTEESRTTAAELYQRYAAWTASNGEGRPLSQRRFGESLNERGLDRIKTGGYVVWRGIELLPEGPGEGQMSLGGTSSIRPLMREYTKTAPSPSLPPSAELKVAS